ncbi:sensor histidine kinase [Polaromonas jejuensis]|uniref:Sensor histidine kinase n=1 Tax=Polaromonas jejuensis TaxID=457502 RepID=A0ABW0QFL4_9BURK|nr:ATP-binding protein [Polaromonas jejuensis]
MLSLANSWAGHTGAVLSAAAMAATMTVAGLAWQRRRNPLDLAYAVATGGWLLYLLSSSASALYDENPLVVFFARLGYQLTILAASFFLLIGVSVIRFEVHTVWMLQGLVGLLLLVWNAWGFFLQDLAYELWVVLNLVCASALFVVLAREVLRGDTDYRWLVLGGGLLGLGLCFHGLLTFSHLHPGTAPAQYFYPALMLLLWLLLTNRPAHARPPVDSAWATVTGFDPETGFAATAVANERRRIAQDLHDGVGSQLVNILATLDTRAPQQQAVALALEQCLMDLKIMVDTVDSTDACVVDVLGCLRYRVQHSLDKLGIQMVWTVDTDGPLQSFRGERALQVLRITQECLSNIMRHAQASVIEVICCYLPENKCLLLEVRDNGRGIASREGGRPKGKGMEGMQRRARELGAHLQITTKAQEGTRVVLIVPMPAPHTSA